MKLTTRIGVALLRLEARLFPLAFDAYPSLASQVATIRPKYPVARYATVADLTTALQALQYTEDPLGGRLDTIRHPTYLQEAMAKHPYQADDCDGFAAYACVALLKSRLAAEAYWAAASWVEKDELAGHAVALFRLHGEDTWAWMGNWRRCKAIPCIGQHDWVRQLEEIRGAAVGAPIHVITAEEYPAFTDARDMLLLRPGRRVRR